MSPPPLPWRERLIVALALLGRLEDTPPGAPAAVLVPLFIADDEPHCWLVRRAAHLRHHPGQIALPGGKPDAADADLRETALREAHEEIGLPATAVDLLGALPARLTSTLFVVTPFVGLIAADFVPVVQASEVGRVFAAPLRAFVSGGELRVPPTLAGREPVPSYLTQGEVVWGATAGILHRLAAALFHD